MVNIFEYYDYHKFLRDIYEERKREDSRFSFRFIGNRVGIDAGYLVKVLNGQKNVAAESVPKFCVFLKFNKRQADYLELLVLFGKAKSDSEIKYYFEKLLSYVEFKSSRVDVDKYEFYRKWYYTAVRELIGFHGFSGDYSGLGKMVVPAITPGEAKKAVSLLDRLGFIRKKDDCSYELASRFITTGEAWSSIAIRTFQEETILLAKEAINRIPKDERDISTLTVSLSRKSFDELREKLKIFRREVLEIAQNEAEANRSYHLNLALFPITKRNEK